MLRIQLREKLEHVRYPLGGTKLIRTDFECGSGKCRSEAFAVRNGCGGERRAATHAIATIQCLGGNSAPARAATCKEDHKLVFLAIMLFHWSELLRPRHDTWFLRLDHIAHRALLRDVVIVPYAFGVW